MTDLHLTDQQLDGQPAVDQDGLVVRDPPAALPEGPSTTAAALVAGVRDHPDHPALGYRNIWLTYAELDARVDAAAGGLAASGVGPGDVVACSLPNRFALVEAFLATQRLGAVFVSYTHLTLPTNREV